MFYPYFYMLSNKSTGESKHVSPEILLKYKRVDNGESLQNYTNHFYKVNDNSGGNKEIFEKFLFNFITVPSNIPSLNKTFEPAPTTNKFSLFFLNFKNSIKS